MSKVCLLDTNIIVDLFENIPDAVQLINSFKPADIAVSVITYTETLVGFDDPQQEKLFENFISRVRYFQIEKSTARIAANLRKKHHFKLPDAYQAAIALEHDLILLTRDTADFDSRVHKFVKVPYRLKPRA